MAYNPNFEEIGLAFIKHYYKLFDVPDGSARAVSLEALYDAENSFFTFEQSQCKGKQAILEKIAVLPFRSIQHAVTKADCQPLPDGSIVVSVIGQLKTDDDPVNSYNHCFVLRQNADGSFFIGNEIFRLVIHG